MLLWIDLETTGLDAQSDNILEVAWQLTDIRLNPLDGMFTHVCDVDPIVWSQIPLNPVVWQMHDESGLLVALEKREYVIRIEDIEDQILAQIEAAGINERIMVAGFSVHFDLGFIREHMPRLADKLSHRVYDVSTLRTFFREVGLFVEPLNLGKHRAYNDVIESMSVARGYLEFTEKMIGTDNAQR